MKTIWKFEIPVDGEWNIPVPKGAEFLPKVEVPAANLIWVWAIVDPLAPLVSRPFRVYGTGHRLGHNPGEYIGTGLWNGGRLVWHVWG